MNRIDRLMGILTMLQSKKFMPAERIAEKFSISIRTVYRDVKALTEIGVPVSFETGRGYFIVQGYFLPPVSFTNEEANALILMESIATHFSDQSIQKHYETALNKVRSVLRGSQKEKLEQLQSQIKTVTSAFGGNNFAYLSEIQNAIATQTILNIEYQNLRDEVSSRAVEPIGLVFYAYNWHMIAWCWWRNDYRDFRASRILKLSSAGTAFRKEAHTDLNEYMKLLPVNY
ncbi:YafY family protein [Agriterribacter sp.]|uniref:helix-turn-helix transcriptional regulator n=1 Tax=Agriterribacter sp. TaxID=2821509 RepID=UPI002BBAB631|nr:YafY family protein [Agriterribacter sp.]HRO48472.1 YafY family protein [Agriterribacter sp.]HRQ17803.1 YafY family protein [Agriterribacter sp.]